MVTFACTGASVHSNRHTPTPEEYPSFSGNVMIPEYSPTPGADASSQSSPGSASDHMGVLPSGSANRTQAPLLPGSSALAAFDAENTKLEARQARGGSDGTAPTNRRQSRLQRNRESARLSRKRRKQYLELLEERVDQLSETLDRARRQHVAKAMISVVEKRRESIFRGTPEALQLLTEGNLSRTSDELRVAVTFQFQQLKSFSVPPSMQFILWLTLQTDAYFRGGRTASERLSAARIGERVRKAVWTLFVSF
jgi:bZIP transcription factor